VGNFDTTFIFEGLGEGVEVMQFSKFLLLIRCVWAVEGEGSTVQAKCVLTGYLLSIRYTTGRKVDLVSSSLMLRPHPLMRKRVW